MVEGIEPTNRVSPCIMYIRVMAKEIRTLFPLLPVQDPQHTADVFMVEGLEPTEMFAQRRVQHSDPYRSSQHAGFIPPSLGSDVEIAVLEDSVPKALLALAI